jgi:hypothetical protein
LVLTVTECKVPKLSLSPKIKINFKKMSETQNNTKKIFSRHNLVIAVPLLTLAMVMGAFGGTVVNSLNSTVRNLTTLAQNTFNAGYGCGTYGAAISATTTTGSSPAYSGACTQAIVVSSSSLADSSSSTLLSSSSTIAVSNSSAISSAVSSLLSSAATVSSSSTAVGTPTLSAKVYLSANFDDNTDSMGTALRAANYIPNSQPYSVAPFNYTGDESLASIPSTIVDWVLLEVRNPSGTVAQTKAVLLNNDGKLVDPSSLSNNISLSNIAVNGNYKIIVRHRNHIAIATDLDITLSQGINTNVDFTANTNVKSNNQTSVGTNSLGQAIYGMYKGNVTGDASISAADRNAVRNAQVAVGYYSADANLSGNISAADRNLVRNAQATTESL